VDQLQSQQINLPKLLSDFDYYCRTLLRIKPKDSSDEDEEAWGGEESSAPSLDGLVSLDLNIPQRLLYYGIPESIKQDRRFHYTILKRGWQWYEKNRQSLRIYILKARQMGSSTLAMARLFHRIHTVPATNSMVVAHDDKATSGLFGMVRLFLAALPEEFRPRTKISNTNELILQDPNSLKGMNSWFRAQTAGNKDIGRSSTIRHLLCSEISSWINPEEVTDGLWEAVPDVADSTIILETTAKGVGSWAHNVWLGCKEEREDALFDPVFLPWYLMPEYQRVPPKDWQPTVEDREFKAEYGLTWKQVYYYRRKVRFFELKHPGQGKRLLASEFPCNDDECWTSSGKSAFIDDVRTWVFKNQVQEPEFHYTVRSGKIIPSVTGELRVWEPPCPGAAYAIGVDVAHGTGGDYSCIQVVAHPGYRQVAEWSHNRTDPKRLAYIIKPIAEWYNEAVVAVEVNGSGMYTNGTLWEMYSNLYRWTFFDKLRNAETQKLGWETSFRTKEMLVDHANSLLYQIPPDCVIRSALVVEQMKSFLAVAAVGGGMSYGSNVRDDELMAWLIAVMCCWQKIAKFDYGETPPQEKHWQPGEFPPMAGRDFDPVTEDILNGRYDIRRGNTDWMAQ
jgi:hypothetical protein